MTEEDEIKSMRGVEALPPAWVGKRVARDQIASRIREIDREAGLILARRPDLAERLAADMDVRKLARAPRPRATPRHPQDFPPAKSLTVEAELRRMFQKGSVLHSNSHSPLRAELLRQGLMAVVNTEEGLFKCYELTGAGAARIG